MDDFKKPKADLIKELLDLRKKNKQLETELADRKTGDLMLIEMINQSPVSIQIMDKEGFSVVINKAHTDFFGAIPPGGYKMFEDPLLLNQGLAEYFQRLQEGEAVFFPDTWYNAHFINPAFPDKLVWVKSMGFPLLKEKGIPKGYVVMHEDITERKNLKAQLEESIQELQNLNLQIENHRKNNQDAIDREKKDISEFLHNQLGQKLTGITLIIDRILKKNKETVFMDELNTIRYLISDSFATIKSIALKLQQSIANEVGIALAIELLVENFAATTEIEIKANIDYSIELDAVKAENIFFITQESFTNIIRHAQASRVILSFKKTKTSVVLTISDNGVGIPSKALASPASFGLKTIRKRAEIAGGYLTIRCKKSKGSEIKIVLPH